MPKEPEKQAEPADMQPGKDDFVPGTESNEDFDTVLSLLSGWIRAGIVDVDVDWEGDIEFEIPGEMRDLLGKEIPSRLRKQHVLRIIHTEVPWLVAAGLRKRTREYLKVRLPETLRDRLDDLVKRSEKAVATVVSGELRERILLRRTTLGYVIREIRSISGSYESDSDGDGRTSLPFTTVEFTFAKPRNRGSLLQFDPHTGTGRLVSADQIQVGVDLHREDIKSLVKELTKLVDKNAE